MMLGLCSWEGMLSQHIGRWEGVVGGEGRRVFPGSRQEVGEW